MHSNYQRDTILEKIYQTFFAHLPPGRERRLIELRLGLDRKAKCRIMYTLAQISEMYEITPVKVAAMEDEMLARIGACLKLDPPPQYSPIEVLAIPAPLLDYLKAQGVLTRHQFMNLTEKEMNEMPGMNPAKAKSILRFQDAFSTQSKESFNGLFV